MDMIQQVVAMQKSCLERDVNATVRVSLLELRGRKFSDLLSQDPQPQPVSIRDSDTNKHPTIAGAEEISVCSSSEVLDCLKMGLARFSAAEIAAGETERPNLHAEPDSTDEPQHTTFHRHPDSHLIFTISILLQGKRSTMPSTASIPGKPPPPPPAPKTTFTGTATPRSLPIPRRELPTHTSTQPQEECLARGTIRVVDLSMPPSTSADAVAPTSEQANLASSGAGQASASSPPQPISAMSPSQRTNSASGSLDVNMSPATTPNQRAVPSPRSPAVSLSDARHMTLQTSSRRLGAQQPTRSKVSSIASGGEPRADVWQAAQAAGLVPSPQSTQAYSADGLSGFEALERALDRSVHGPPLVRYKMHPLTRILRSALLGTCNLLVIPPTGPDEKDTSGVYERAHALIERLRSIPQLRPVCDVGVLDLHSDVGKWIRYENNNLRADLKGAREKIALLQKYLGARGDHEMKTWDLWKELQGSEGTAKELQEEIRELKEALGSARNAAAASAASLELAKARANAEAARSTIARRDAASAAARADAMEVAVERMAQQLANVASASTADVALEQPETSRTSASPRITTGKGASRSGGPHVSSEQCVLVKFHVVRGYVAVRVRCLHTHFDTKPPEDSCSQPSGPTPVAAPLTLQQLQADLIAALQSAEQRHQEQCSHLPGTIGSRAPPDSFSAISSAKSLVTLLARVSLRRIHASSGLWAQGPEQQAPLCHSLKLPEAVVLSEAKGDYTDRSSLSERAPMPHTPTTAPHVPPLPCINAYVASADTQQHPAARASPDHLKQPRSPIPPITHPEGPTNASDRPPGSKDAAPRAQHVSPFENHGASMSYESSVYSPRGAPSNLVSQGSMGTLATEDSAVLESPKLDVDAGGCTAWPANLGLSHSEWMAALALVPQLPLVLQSSLDELVHRQGDDGQEQEVLRQQVEQFRDVVAMIFQPFEEVPDHVLWALYGWLEPWFRSDSVGTGGAIGVSADAGSLQQLGTDSTKGTSASVHDRIPVGSTPGHVFVSQSGIPPQSRQADRGDLAPSPGHKAWRLFAAMLHGMVTTGFKGYSDIFREQQAQHRHKLAMLDECIKAYQACLDGLAEIHRNDAGKLAELGRFREDAEARAQVFDDTVANLVRAKMAHATADVTLRAMRDQIEQLSAQVPLQNGVGTNAPSWRLANHAARLRAAAEPGVTAAVHKRLLQCDSGSKCRSAAVVSKTISGLSSYFSSRPVVGHPSGNRRNS